MRRSAVPASRLCRWCRAGSRFGRAAADARRPRHDSTRIQWPRVVARLAAAYEDALTRKRPILVRAGTESSVWCKQLEAELAKPAVQDASAELDAGVRRRGANAARAAESGHRPDSSLAGVDDAGATDRLARWVPARGRSGEVAQRKSDDCHCSTGRNPAGRHAANIGRDHAVSAPV